MACSPALFDIYMEDFYKEVKNRLPTDIVFWYLAYADDLVFSVPLKHLSKTMEIF